MFKVKMNVKQTQKPQHLDRSFARHQATDSVLSNKRQKTSRQLHDEITQTLVAINLRLLTLKRSVKTNSENLKKEIAETQRLVQQSKKPIHRLAQKILAKHET